MARKIVVTSGKGGVGKTTVCCNLGVQLARRGYRVIVCDLDFGLNNADVVLGIENRALLKVPAELPPDRLAIYQDVLQRMQ